MPLGDDALRQLVKATSDALPAADTVAPWASRANPNAALQASMQLRNLKTVFERVLAVPVGLEVEHGARRRRLLVLPEGDTRAKLEGQEGHH